MEEILFQSEDFFCVMDFSLSHKVLLIRGTTVTEKAGEYISHENIDLLFDGTHFVQIPTFFENGLLIKKGAEDLTINADITLKAGQYFEIINNKNSYFIKARGFEILKNNLDTAESSIDGKKYRPPSEYIRKEYIENYPYLLEGLEKHIDTFKKSDNWTLWNKSQRREVVLAFVPVAFYIKEETILEVIS
ncbi:hypothetical protein [Emticicia soli]|uniref:Uncharacterized protein n=1 Tax=Emticicia soli TaxID=2027878 RepID=A0ABW5JA95_9BACT